MDPYPHFREQRQREHAAMQVRPLGAVPDRSARAKGVEFKKPPTKEFYGVEALFKDDSGNRFSLGQLS